MPKRKETNKIVIHCAATKPNMDIGVDEITKWHMQRGFRTCGYHFVIRRDGTVETGRAENEIGAHAYGNNSDSIGVALVGGLSEDNQPENNFTVDQWVILAKLVEELIERHPFAEVMGHNDISKKDCPCFNVKEWRQNEISDR